MARIAQHVRPAALPQEGRVCAACLRQWRCMRAGAVSALDRQFPSSSGDDQERSVQTSMRALSHHFCGSLPHA